MELENLVTLNQCNYNDSAWVSVDPHTGNLVPYPPKVSTEIESAYQNYLSNKLEKTCFLPHFHKINIHFDPEGFHFQTTDKSGLRSVFRESIDKGDIGKEVTIMRTIIYDENAHSWYIKRNKVTHIGFLVDSSGSMFNLYNTIVEKGIENFIEKQKDVSHTVRFYGASFSNQLTIHYDGEDLKQIDNLRETFYQIQPMGGTAFYDSLLEIIRLINMNYRNGDEVVICTMTDGYDNSSVQSKKYLKNSILHKKKQGWLFVVFGTDDININHMCDITGIDPESAMKIGKSDETSKSAYQSLSAGLKRFRNGETPKISFSPLERHSSYTKP